MENLVNYLITSLLWVLLRYSFLTLNAPGCNFPKTAKCPPNSPTFVLF